MVLSGRMSRISLSGVLALFLICLFWMHGAAPHAYSEADKRDILKRADQARGYSREGIRWEVTVQSIENSRSRYITYDVQARGFDFFAEVAAPPRHRGGKLLMVSGNMWYHKPGLSKPFPISQRQRLMGDAAYGDIAATNYAGDYDSTLTGTEEIDGEECLVFDLRASARDTTYDRIVYWVSKSRNVGVKAEYYTISDKLIKSARMEYENVVNDSQPFISRITIFDELMSDSRTTLEFDSPSLERVEDHVFNVNLMVR